jgi:hypothetical protein
MSNFTLSPKLLLRMWSIYPVLVPFYLMGKTPIPGTEKVESGVPQIADYYLVGLMALVFGTLPFRLHRWAVAVALALGGFVVYTGLVNFAWAAHLEDMSLLKSTVFYTYDVMLLLTCLVLHAHFKDAFLWATVRGVGASVVLQALLSPLAPQGNYTRQAVFFNDENQLGYFCVLAASIFAAATRRLSIPLGYRLVVYAAVAYLALLSQSRAALLGLGALMVLAQLDRPVRLMFSLGAALAVAALIAVAPPTWTKAEERLVVAGGYDTAATRGYDRIVNYPEMILFGAGEGAYGRFRSELYGSELHSSYGTLLFCYGIPGTLCFVLALVAIFRRDWTAAIFLVPAFIHGSGHHGLRFAFFWVMLAFLCCKAMAPVVQTDPDPLPGDAAQPNIEPQPAA